MFSSQIHQICIKLLGNRFTDGNNISHDALLKVEHDSWMSHDRFSPVWRILPKAIWRAPSWDHPDPRSFQTGALVTQDWWRFPHIHIQSLAQNFQQWFSVKGARLPTKIMSSAVITATHYSSCERLHPLWIYRTLLCCLCGRWSEDRVRSLDPYPWSDHYLTMVTWCSHADASVIISNYVIYNNTPFSGSKPVL